MVAAAQRIEAKDPDVVAENRVWSFLDESPDRVRQTAVQVADCDWEKGLVGYDWRRGPSLAQSGQVTKADAAVIAGGLPVAVAVSEIGVATTVVAVIPLAIPGDTRGSRRASGNVHVLDSLFGLDGFFGNLLGTSRFGGVQGTNRVDAVTTDVNGALDRIAKRTGINRGVLGKRFHRAKGDPVNPTAHPQGKNRIDERNGDVIDGDGDVIGNVITDD